MDLAKSLIAFACLTVSAILLLEHREDRRDTARFARQSMLQCGLEAEREFNRQSLRFVIALAEAPAGGETQVAPGRWEKGVLPEYKGLMQSAGLLITDAPENSELSDAYNGFLKEVTLFMQAELQRKASLEGSTTSASAQLSTREVKRHIDALSVMVSMKSLVAAHRQAVLKAAMEYF